MRHSKRGGIRSRFAIVQLRVHLGTQWSRTGGRISLAYVRLIETLDDTRKWLGLDPPNFEKRTKSYRRPEKPKCTAPSPLSSSTDESDVTLSSSRPSSA